MEWYWIVAIVVLGLAALVALSIPLYKPFFKRFYDVLLSALALIILSPLLLCLVVIGAIVMQGNPFFVQKRAGKKDKTGKERIFALIKFRTMSNAKDKEGNLLPDEVRLNRYGQFLRSSSLDELPELINILAGQMSLIGPRPLYVKYLELYNEEQRHRHDVLPGLTGYAQCHGRNLVSWDERFKMDVAYTRNITFKGDLKIIFDTVKCVLKKDGISSSTSVTMEDFTGNHD